MAESQIASSKATEARSSSSEAPSEAGQHDRNHHNAAHLLPSRGISLNIASTNTSHGRPAAVKHM
jgi:[calcium/calmodulin-dependent protein kinase] kinase